MKLRLATPGVLIDIGRLSELSFVRDEGDRVTIGALTRHRDLEISEVLQAHVPLLAHVAGQIGTRRSAIAAPSAAPLPTATRRRTCRRRVWPSGPPSPWWPDGERRDRRDRLLPGLPGDGAGAERGADRDQRAARLNGAGWSFQKFNRRAQDWAIVGVATVAGTYTRVGLINMGPVPLRATAVEEALAGGARRPRPPPIAATGSILPRTSTPVPNTAATWPGPGPAGARRGRRRERGP